MRRREWVLLGFLVAASPFVYADQQDAGLPGYCAIGGEPITITDPISKRMSPSPDYREIECRYTNGQEARVAVCQHHADTYTSADYSAIWEGIKRGWSSDMGTWTRERREKYWKFYEEVTIQSCGGE